MNSGIVLPVKQDDIYMGLAEVSGLLRFEENALILEYQVKDEVLGMFDSKMKSFRIPLNIIDFIELEKKWFVWRFNIYLNRLFSSDKPIRIEENCLSFKFKKKEIEKAKSLKSQLLIEISEQKLKDLQEEPEPVSKRTRIQPEKDPGPIEFRDKKNNQSQPGQQNGLKNMLRNDEQR